MAEVQRVITVWYWKVMNDDRWEKAGDKRQAMIEAEKRLIELGIIE